MLFKHDKVWITGAEGQIGTAFSKLLDSRRVRILLTDVDDVDITDVEAVKNFVEINRPDLIINCAGVRGIQFCEENKDLAYKVNALGPRNLSVSARMLHANIIHLSTDDIFDGQHNEPYDEFTFPMPTTIYGKSKLAGENFVKTIAPKYLIVRSSWVYGNGDNFVTKLINDSKTKDKLVFPKDQIGSPTSAVEVAKVIAELIEHESYGTYHAVCKGSCSRYEFAKKIAELCKLNCKIEAAENMELEGPDYAVLDNLMLRLNDIPEPPAWEKALEDYLKANNFM